MSAHTLCCPGCGRQLVWAMTVKEADPEQPPIVPTKPKGKRGRKPNTMPQHERDARRESMRAWWAGRKEQEARVVMQSLNEFRPGLAKDFGL